MVTPSDTLMTAELKTATYQLIGAAKNMFVVDEDEDIEQKKRWLWQAWNEAQNAMRDAEKEGYFELVQS